jgi:hypothetical protein
MSDGDHTQSRRTILGTTGAALAGAIAGTGAASADEQGDGNGDESGGSDGGGDEGDKHAEVMQIISGWEKKQRKETKKTMEKYGVPEGVTERRLMWYDADPWKRIEIFRDATQHKFPAPHPDFFEQFIDYQVPSDKADELTAYDGSVMFERTTGVMSARCHTEWANFVALNLADDIVSGGKSVTAARQDYANIVKRKMKGESPAYTEGFQFELPEGDQGDPDKVTIGKDGC